MLLSFARGVRAARLGAGMTQRLLAAAAGVSEATVRRVERGASSTISVDSLQRIGLALDRPVSVQLGRGAAEPVDAGHLAMQELIVGLVARAGYRPHVELPSVRHGTWRSTDVAAVRPADRTLVGVECWNTIGDVGAGFRSSDRKRRDLEELASATWGPGDHHIGVVWVVRATRANRALLARYPSLFASRFRGSSGQWVLALVEGITPPGDDGLVWCDVGARGLSPWRRPNDALPSSGGRDASPSHERHRLLDGPRSR